MCNRLVSLRCGELKKLSSVFLRMSKFILTTKFDFIRQEWSYLVCLLGFMKHKARSLNNMYHQEINII